jgi:hypothetical protein
MIKKLVSLSTAFIFSCALLPAAIIPGVTIQSVSSQYSNGSSDQRPATNLVNGSGLFGNNHTYNITGSGWLTADSSAGAYSNAFVVFDLGAVHNLSQIKVYNYDEGSPLATGNACGVQQADILFGTDLGVYTVTNSGVLFNKAPGGTSTAPNFKDFSQLINVGGVSARYVRVNVATNWGGSTGVDANAVGLCKVLFIDTNVPASATLATENFASNSVTVWFSEPVSPLTATNLGNYSLTSSGADVPQILAATMNPFNDSVTLTTSQLTDSFNAYTLNVTGIAAGSDETLFTNSVALQSQLAFWLRADVGVTTNTDGTVATWADQSGNGNNAMQTNSGVNPTYVASDVNGLRSVQFGTGHYLDIPFSPTMGVQRDYSIVAVLTTTTSGNNEIISRAAVNRAAPFDARYSSTAITAYRGNEGGSGAFSSATATKNTPVHVPGMTAIVVSGTNETFYLNGLLNGSAIILIGFKDSQSFTRIGGRADLGVSLAGTLSEVMLFRGTLTTSDRLALNAYFANKYALAITDLAFQTQPTNTTVYEGQTARFSASAVSSSPTAVTYQWLLNGANIADATNATYTTPTQALANNGASYTVVAKSVPSSATSNPAMLTVLADTTAPTVAYVGAEVWSQSNIVVVYSEPVDPATATAKSNYSLTDNNSGAVTIHSVAMGDSPNKVILYTSVTNNLQLAIANVQDLFGNVMSPATPTVGFYPNLSLWLRADTGVTTDGAGYVTYWADQSGNGSDVVSDGIQQYEPVLTNGYNGLPAVYFNGTNGLVNAAATAALNITGDMAIYAVAEIDDYSSSGGREIVSKAAGTAGNIPASYDFYARNTGKLWFYRGNGGSGGNLVSYGSLVSVTTPAPGVPHIIVANMAGTTASQYLDGVTNGTAQITVPLADGGQYFWVGARSDFFVNNDPNAAAPAMKGNMSEILLFNVALSDADRASLDNYLGKKYAINIGLLPTVTISTAGGMIVLSWPATASGYVLEATSSLQNPNWTAVPDAVPTNNGGTNSVSLNLTGNSQFYRLHQQQP